MIKNVNEKLGSINNIINKFLIINKLQDLKRSNKCVIEYDKDFNIKSIYTSKNFDEELAYELIELNRIKGNEAIIETVYYHNTNKNDKMLVVYDYDSGNNFCLLTQIEIKNYKLPINKGSIEEIRYKIFDAIDLNENLINSMKGINKYNL